jgi:hypothetical protein
MAHRQRASNFAPFGSDALQALGRSPCIRSLSRQWALNVRAKWVCLGIYLTSPLTSRGDLAREETRPARGAVTPADTLLAVLPDLSCSGVSAIAGSRRARSGLARCNTGRRAARCAARDVARCLACTGGSAGIRCPACPSAALVAGSRASTTAATAASASTTATRALRESAGAKCKRGGEHDRAQS